MSNKSKCFLMGIVIMLLGFFILSSLIPLLVLGLLILISIIIINSCNYKIANYYVKVIYLSSIISLSTLIFLFDFLFLDKVDKLSLYYQFLVFSFIFSLIVYFLSILIINIKKENIKNNHFNVVELSNEDLNQFSININPASGLPMKNSIDSVGNVIGQNSNSYIDRD